MKLFIVSVMAAAALAAAPFFKRDMQKPFVSLNHIALYVEDLKKSTDFYERVVGLQKMEEPFKDGRHTWFKVGEHAQLHLISGSGKEKRPDKNTHLCFTMKSVEAFAATLVTERIPYENWAGEKGKMTNRTDGVKQIYVQDPDGFWVEVNDDGY